MNSAKPCTPLSDKINAAKTIYAQCPYWQQSDAALKLLGEKFPSFDREICLLKSVVINALYGTQVFAIAKMADHVCKTMYQHQGNKDKPDILVDAIATVSVGGGKTKHFFSFASKFCHFFVDDEKFPIYDEAARTTLALHLGKSEPRYTTFCSKIEELRKLGNLSCSLSALDRYLWIRGLHVKYEKFGKAAKINTEIKQFFQQAEAENDANFAVLINQSNSDKR